MLEESNKRIILRFIYSHARLPKDRELITGINSAADRLLSKLENLDIDSLDISGYNRRYFGSKLANLDKHLKLCLYILLLSLSNSDIQISRFVFLDYGGGSGILCLLAKELGVGTVIYSDIYDISCNDARNIAKSIGNEADYYINGDIDDVIDFLRKNEINCNVIASYDVIEHIYDIGSFFNKIPILSNGPLTVVVSSGANTFNLLIKKKLMKKQLEVEYKDREDKFNHKDRDCLKSYYKARTEIIYEYLKKLDKEITDKEITQLTQNTRGMVKTDIQRCVYEYLRIGKFPPKPSHPTNTCDPYTGNWTEHLMNPYGLGKILVKKGFKVEILSGYYGMTSKSVIKRFLFYFLNLGIYILKKKSIRLAPFYTIYGKRD